MEHFKAKLNIIDVVQYFIPLRKKGINHFASCPFHSEKSDSFCVSEFKQMYHCFGCGESGDAIKFVQMYKKIDFKEAVQELCDIFNLQSPLNQTSKHASSKFKDFSQKCKDLSARFYANLQKRKDIQNYLLNRGFNMQTCAAYNIGFCEGVEDILHFFSPAQAQEIGLITSFAQNELLSAQAQDSNFFKALLPKIKAFFSLESFIAKRKGVYPLPAPLNPEKIKAPLFLFGNQGESRAVSASSSKAAQAAGAACLFPLFRTTKQARKAEKPTITSAECDFALVPNSSPSPFAKKEIKETSKSQEVKAKNLSQNSLKAKTPFKNRIIITLFNRNHQAIGFVGRTHPYANFLKSPKYLNSKESFLYQKSLNLYNFSRAKQEISKTGKVLVVEGYFDAIAANLLGIKNCVATGGTAFNDKFLSALLALNAQITFLFDSDSSGQEANLRACAVLLKNHIYDARVCVIENLNAKGTRVKDLGEVLELRQKPRFIFHSLLGFFIHKNLEKCASPAQKDSFLNTLKDMIIKEQNFYQKDFLVSEVCAHTGVPREYFLSQKVKNTTHLGQMEAFLSALVQDEDNYYIAKNILLLKSLPQDIQAPVAQYLQDKTLGSLQKYAFLEQKAGYNFEFAIYNLHLRYFERALAQAKARKDIAQILSAQDEIKALKNRLCAKF